MGRVRKTALLILFFATFSPSCAAFHPTKLPESASPLHVSTKEQQNTRVSVAVLTEAESRTYFGRPLAPHGIQAVWVKVENGNS